MFATPQPTASARHCTMNIDGIPDTYFLKSTSHQHYRLGLLCPFALFDNDHRINFRLLELKVILLGPSIILHKAIVVASGKFTVAVTVDIAAAIPRAASVEGFVARAHPCLSYFTLSGSVWYPTPPKLVITILHASPDPCERRLPSTLRALQLGRAVWLKKRYVSSTRAVLGCKPSITTECANPSLQSGTAEKTLVRQ